MMIEVKLPPDVESELAEQAALVGQDVPTFVAAAIRQMLTADESSSDVSYEQWRCDFRAWVASHTTKNPSADDSRESIYD